MSTAAVVTANYLGLPALRVRNGLVSITGFWRFRLIRLMIAVTAKLGRSDSCITLGRSIACILSVRMNQPTGKVAMQISARYARGFVNHRKRQMKRRERLGQSEPAMPKHIETEPNIITPVGSRVAKFITDRNVPPNVGISSQPYVEIDGFRFINIFVQFSQDAADEAPVDLGISFAFDEKGTMSADRYINVEYNMSPQDANVIKVSGSGSRHAAPYDNSSYLTRIAVMGPFVSVSVHNRALIERKVSVWGYLVS
jgi:hypothetical protein